MACDAATLIASAYSNGYAKLSERGLLECLVASACAGGGGGGGGSGQLKYYLVDPNSELIVPDDQTKPAFAATKDGTGSIYSWNVTTLVWN